MSHTLIAFGDAATPLSSGDYSVPVLCECGWDHAFISPILTPVALRSGLSSMTERHAVLRKSVQSRSGGSHE